MRQIRLLKTGHGDLLLAEWEKDQEVTVCLARTVFQENLTKGRMAFRIFGPGQTEMVTDFDPDLDADVLIVPAITGG